MFDSDLTVYPRLVICSNHKPNRGKLKIYCGSIWRNVYFPVHLDYRSSFASKIDATHVKKSTLNHTVCNALKCRENASECLDFEIFWEGPTPPP